MKKDPILTELDRSSDIVLKVQKWLEDTPVHGMSEELVYTVLVSLLYLIVAVALFFIVKFVLLRSVKVIFKNSRQRHDQVLAKRSVLIRLALVLPMIVIKTGVSVAFKYFSHAESLLSIVADSMFIIVILLVILSVIGSFGDIYESKPYSNNRPIRGYLQSLQILISVFAILAIVSMIFNLKMTHIFTSLGAVAAVLVLVFRDTILSFVASIQLLANDMLKPGDWITMPTRDTDGTVLEMNLNTVKVQNWNKTISTIPTYALVTESFTNWKGMEESGGRQIKRSVSIDMLSIKFCDDNMIERFRRIDLLREYIDDKVEEFKKINEGIDISVTRVNSHRLTNLGLFRRYLEIYLSNHPQINNDMIFIIRQLQSTELGVPVQVFVFSKEKRWAEYEAIQDDIFDHIFAILPEFDLSVFQYPTNSVLAGPISQAP